LDVYQSSGTEGIRLSSPTGRNDFNFISGATSVFRIATIGGNTYFDSGLGVSGGGTLIFRQNTNELFKVGSYGKVMTNVNFGVYDSNPQASLSVIKPSSGNVVEIGSSLSNRGDMLTITASGNVGIGTTAPSARLTVLGSQIADTILKLQGVSGQTAPSVYC